MSDTATMLLDAAEVSFATRGIDGASLRAIMRDASANPAAVHYHFGSREALVGAVLDRILLPINERRLELLAQLSERPQLTEVIECLVRPDVEALGALHRRNPDAAGLIGLIYSRPNLFVTSRVEAMFEPVAQAFMPHLIRDLGHVDPAAIAWRVRWGVFGVLAAVLAASGEDLGRHLTDMDATTRRIVSFASAGLAAPREEDRDD